MARDGARDVSSSLHVHNDTSDLSIEKSEKTLKSQAAGGKARKRKRRSRSASSKPQIVAKASSSRDADVDKVSHESKLTNQFASSATQSESSKEVADRLIKESLDSHMDARPTKSKVAKREHARARAVGGDLTVVPFACDPVPNAVPHVAALGVAQQLQQYGCDERRESVRCLHRLGRTFCFFRLHRGLAFVYPQAFLVLSAYTDRFSPSCMKQNTLRCICTDVLAYLVVVTLPSRAQCAWFSLTPGSCIRVSPKIFLHCPLIQIVYETEHIALYLHYSSGIP